MVTWLTSTNFGLPELLKMPLADVPLVAALLDEGLVPLPPQAAIAVLTSAAAPPVSAARRDMAASG